MFNKKVYDWERARYGAQVINDKEPTMEEYLLSKQEESGKERKTLPFRHTWTISNDDDEEESYDFGAIRFPAKVIDGVISP